MICNQCNKCGKCGKPYSSNSTYAEICKDFEKKKMTNFEKIKAMTIEEMEIFIIMIVLLYGGKTPTNVKEWLESEVEE